MTQDEKKCDLCGDPATVFSTRRNAMFEALCKKCSETPVDVPKFEYAGNIVVCAPGFKGLKK